MSEKQRKTNKGQPHAFRFSNPVDEFLRTHCQEVTKKNKTNYVEDLIKQDLWKRGIEI